MKLLSVNAGSSTLKFRMYEMPEEKVICKGAFDRIGIEGSNFSLKFADKKIEEDVELKDHNDAVKILLEQLVKNGIVNSLDEIEAVGHRVVHGGSKYASSVLITDEVIKEIEELSDLAPLHNPAALKGIKAFSDNVSNAKMVACFDTAFHQTMEKDAYLYSVPYSWYEKYGVRKYGFHGMSHKFISEKLSEMLGKSANLIIAHIGSGASVSAVKEGKCVDTTMGFTPNAGVMMGTRSGDIDYSMIGYLTKKGLSYEEVDNSLNKDSGLLGIIGKSDLRDIDELFEKGDEKAVLGVNMYTTRIADYIAKYYLKLEGKVDAICFTAGVGENDDIIRKEVVKKLAPLGIVLDEDKNKETLIRKGKEGIISKAESSVPVYVLATDEELMIARDTFDLVA